MKGWIDIFKKRRQRMQNYGYTCDSCGAELFDYPAHRLCVDCENTLDYNRGTICPKCGRKGITAGVCLTCKTKPPAFTAGVCAFAYNGLAASLVNRIKTGNVRPALFLGERTADAFLGRFPAVKTQFPIPLDGTSGDSLWILPVPCTEQKLRERGYNQAELLADAIAGRLRQSGVFAQVESAALQKTRDTEQQKHLHVKERIQNLVGAYHLHKRAFCKGKTFLIVDDVLTTGTTGSTIAAMLLKAGAKAAYFAAVVGVDEQK